MDNPPVTAAPDQNPPAPVRRWVWKSFGYCLVALGVFLAGIGVFHAPLLRFCSSRLIHEDPAPQGKFSVLLYHFPQWSESYERVARILPKDGQVLLFHGKQTRLMRLGLEKPWWQTDIDQLGKKGITNLRFLDAPDSHFRYLYEHCPDIAKWLDENPDSSLCVLHSRFQGAGMKRILARHIPSRLLDRLVLIPVNDPDYDPELWWRKKEGQAAFIGGWSHLIFDLLLGDGGAPGPDWDPKAYEEALP